MKLLDRVRTEVRKKHLLIHTEEAYFVGDKQHPKDMDEKKRPQRARLSSNAEK
jgi:hypothetical protein